jgi:alpha-L-rhamnosidase
MTPVGRPHRLRRSTVLGVTCLAALALVFPGTSAASPNTYGPDWQHYVQAPSSATVCPTAVTSTSGTVTGAQHLVCGGTGGATLTLAAGGPTPTIVLDYGKEVGGLPYFDVSAATGSPTLKAGYSESKRYLTPNGDGGPPWAEGDPNRWDTYTVTAPGTITNRAVQGGERYEIITLTSPGTLTLTAAGIHYIADRTPASGYQGHFLSSSDELNRIWYDGAYTAQLDSVPTGSLPGAWTVKGGALDAYGVSDNFGVGLLHQGATWGDYTTTFDTNIVANQAGWVVRGQGPGDGYLFILNADNDTTGTPNTLQEFDLNGGTYTNLGSVALPIDLKPGTWHTVSTTVSGTIITISLDKTQVARLDSATFPAGAHPAGTVGFREYAGEEANFRNLNVVGSSGATVYNNALNNASALADFAISGVNTVPSILDGAKRDRAIWVGDINIEGPTVYYSTNTTDYIKSSLQILGSYQLSSGFVTGALPPQNPVHTGPLTPGTTGTYSTSYSMYWVLGLAGYYLYTGDIAFVKQEWPVVERELAWNATQVDANGLIVTDGGTGADWDFYDGAKTGEVTAYNVLYYKALVDGASLATAAGQTAQAATYTQRAGALRTAINTRLFNNTTGLYNISNTVTTGVAQDVNSLAVLYGVAPAEKNASILAKLKTALWGTYGPLPFSADLGYQKTISPFVSGYELNARLANNDTANAEALLSTEWGHMIAPGPDNDSTMWENINAADGTPGLGTGTSLAHGWSTMPTSALSSYVLGIQPVTPGYATWSVQPHLGSLAWAQGQAPTPHGPVQVSWTAGSARHGFSMNVTAPSGTSGTIAVPVSGTDTTVTVNGRSVWRGGRFTAASGVSGASQDAGYVYLTGVRPGTYAVSATQGR